MHHYLSKNDWMEELSEELVKMGHEGAIQFDPVKDDWENGRDPIDVAATIMEGKHPHIQPDFGPVKTAEQ